MKIRLHNLRVFIILLTFFLSVSFVSGVYGQSVGDYKSVANGNWTALSSWQYYNGSTWVTPSGTSPQGYPGQFTGAGDVLVQAGNMIKIDASGISTQQMGILTISGTLELTGIGTGSTGTNFNFITQTIIVTPLLGIITFINKTNLILPSDATLQVVSSTSPLYNGLNGDCNHNQDITIGSSVYAYCNGAGLTGLTFVQVMAGGGTLNAIPTSNTPVCQGNPVYLFGSYTGVQGATVTYSWAIKDPNNSITTTSTQNPIISNPILGTYTITLICNTTYNSNAYSNYETISVLVNALPSAPSGTLAQSFCASNNPTVANLAATGTAIQWYAASSGGSPLATTTALVNGTHYFASQTNSCESSSRLDVTATVSPISVGGTVTGGSTICAGSPSGLLTLSGQTGIITKWQSSVSPFSTWTDIANTAATYTSGVLSETTLFRAIVTSGVCSTDTSTVATVTVSNTLFWANLQWPPPSTICQGVSLTAYGQVYQPNVTPGIGLQGAGITVEFGYATSNTNPNTWNTWTAASFNGLGGGSQNDEYQYTFTPPSSGTYYYTFRYRSGSCGWQYGGYKASGGNFWDGSTNISGILTVNPILTVPIIGTITQPDCKTITGSVVLSGLPSGAWTLTRSPGAITTNGSGTSTTISGIAAPGNYTYTVTNASGCTSASTVSGSIVLNTVTTATWNGLSWVNGPPISSQPLVFSGNFNSTGDLTACSCQVSSGTVKINSGHTMTITNEVAVSGGSLNFEDSASLVQINDAAINSGTIKYKRYTAPISKNTDYTYWSSPVTLQDGSGYLLGSVVTSPYYLSFDSTANDWKYEIASTPMKKGIGYGIQGPTTFAGSPYLASFIGVPNNGLVTVPVTYNNTLNLLSTNPDFGISYFLGNPYPSAINADKFLGTNASVLDGTLYFWTHYTEISATNLGPNTFNYASDDYASYNYTGGVSGSGFAASNIGSSAIAKDIPTGKIAAGQGFFATGIATGNVNFTNDMRIAGTTSTNGTGANQQFFKTSSTKTKIANSIEKNRIWLDLSNNQGAFKQTLVGYITGATNDYDDRFDGESFDGNEFVDFYSVLQDKNFTIQGRALPFDESDEVSLGFRSSIDGYFTINIDQVDGVLTNQAVFIEDKLTNKITDLKSGNYTFTTVAGTFNDRLVLRYTNKTLATSTFDVATNKVLVSTKSKQIKINSFAETIDTVSIYDLLGRQIYQKINVNTNELSIANLVSSHQTLVVKTSLQNGETTTDKIIF